MTGCPLFARPILSRAGLVTRFRLEHSLPNTNAIVSASSRHAAPLSSLTIELAPPPSLVSASFSTSAVASAHKPYWVKKVKKNLKFSAGVSKRPRISFFTKGALEEAENEFQSMVEAQERARYERMREEGALEQWERERGNIEKVKRDFTQEEEVGKMEGKDAAMENEMNAEEKLDVETKLASYRQRTLDLVVDRVEEALLQERRKGPLLLPESETRLLPYSKSGQDNPDSESGQDNPHYETPSPPVPVTGKQNVWTDETRERMGEICSFWMEKGAVYPPDLVRFMTSDPNPAGICSIPADRLIEVSNALVTGIGLRDKALLSVIFHNDLQVFAEPIFKLYENLEFLRQEGVALSETLPTILITCPGLLVDFDQADWKARREWFDYNFTRRTFGELLITQPQVFFHTLEDIQDRFNYVFFEMGLDQKQMMECNLFSYSIDHIIIRHEFLLRCGYYKFPDPKKRVINLNPHLSKILDLSDSAFVKLIPGFDKKDFFVFKLIMKVEMEERMEAEEERRLQVASKEDKLKNTPWEYPQKGVFKSWSKKKYFSRDRGDLGLGFKMH